MLRKLCALSVLVFAASIVGCGATIEEKKADATGGEQLDAATQQSKMMESMKNAPPEQQARMQQMMEAMKNMQKGGPQGGPQAPKP